MSSLSGAEVYLETCALGYAASVALGPDAGGAEWLRSKEVLREAAVAYSASLGKLDAAERSELLALRRLLDGMRALRAELAAGATDTGEAMTTGLALETMDALLPMNPLPDEARATGALRLDVLVDIVRQVGERWEATADVALVPDHDAVRVVFRSPQRKSWASCEFHPVSALSTFSREVGGRKMLEDLVVSECEAALRDAWGKEG